MKFRDINAEGVWKCEYAALKVFAKAFTVDCDGSDETFHRIYGWTDKALQNAKAAVGL